MGENKSLPTRRSVETPSGHISYMEQGAGPVGRDHAAEDKQENGGEQNAARRTQKCETQRPAFGVGASLSDFGIELHISRPPRRPGPQGRSR